MLLKFYRPKLFLKSCTGGGHLGDYTTLFKLQDTMREINVMFQAHFKRVFLTHVYRDLKDLLSPNVECGRNASCIGLMVCNIRSTWQYIKVKVALRLF